MLDVAWILIAAALVFLMQAGFTCLESGLTRSKNSINVAVKNLADLCLSVIVFWIVGYAFLFGESFHGGIGVTDFAISFESKSGLATAFFLFQTMFCATAATIVSGAVAERLRFKGYLIITLLITGLIYPLFGHWAWNGALSGSGHLTGWLGKMGFVDFAGASVVHSVGGWIALAALIIVGPRTGRFGEDGEVRKITGSNLPISVVGVVLLWFGWFGFNGGSTFSMNDRVPSIIVNTLLAGSCGGVMTLAVGWIYSERPNVEFLINGSLAGLVSITASCHAVEPIGAVAIGAIGGLVMYVSNKLLLHKRIDDAICAVPVHLFAGIWGTLAVALFGQPEMLGTGLTRFHQFGVQALGVFVCAFWAFIAGLTILYIVNRLTPLRVNVEDETIGLNASEHGATTELLDLLRSMDRQTQTGDLGMRVAVDPFTEVGQIADRYNRVMETLQKAVSRAEAVFRDIKDGIVTFTQDGILTSFNPSAEALFGYGAAEVIGKPARILLNSKAQESGKETSGFANLLRATQEPSVVNRAVGIRKDKNSFPIALNITEGEMNGEVVYTGVIRDVAEQEAAEKKAENYLKELELERANIRAAHKDLEAQVKKLDRARKATLNLLQDREESSRRVIKAEKQTQLILDTALDCFIIFDDCGVITKWNKRSEIVFGWTSDEVLGKPVLNIIVPARFRKAHEQAVTQFLETEQGVFVNKRIEILALHRDGHELPIEIAVTPVQSDDTYIFSAFLREISERKQYEQALYTAKEEAEAASLAKSEFLANVSHEIRTPMNGIIGMTELLLDTPLSGEQRAYAHTTSSSAEALLGILNDILDFSKIEARQIQLETIPFDVHLMMNDLMDLLATRVQHKDVELIFRFEPSRPTRVLGDPGRIRQVLLNLAGNAIKFTEKGSVLIDVGYVGESEDHVELSILIKDTGIGIPAEMLEHIFEKFTQADSSTTRHFGGTGLGLSISKQLADLMAATLNVSSQIDVGTEFTLCVTLALDKRKHTQMVPPADLADARILAVDDHEVNRRILDEILVQWTPFHKTVASGEEGLALLREAAEAANPYHIALVDFAMPNMDGAEFGQLVKADPTIRETELAMLTSLGEWGNPQRVKEVGYSAFLIKPIRQHILLNVLKLLWGAKKVGKTVDLITQHSLGDTRDRIPSADILFEPAEPLHHAIGAKILLVEDNPVNQKVATKMLESFGCDVDLADNGRIALEMILQKDYAVLFMDCQMPEMNGYETTIAIRQREAYTQSDRIPIIAMTANVMKNDRDKCIEAGMDDYIPKPTRKPELRRMLKKWCPIQEDTSPSLSGGSEGILPLEQEAKNNASAEQQKPFDLDEALASLDGDMELLQELIHLFFEDGPPMVSNMETAIEANNATSLFRAAHTVKCSLGHFGTSRAYHLAQKLEAVGRDQEMDDAMDMFGDFREAYDTLGRSLEMVRTDPSRES